MSDVMSDTEAMLRLASGERPDRVTTDAPKPAAYIRAADVAACDITNSVRTLIGLDHAKAQELYGLHLKIYRRLLEYRTQVHAERSA